MSPTIQLELNEINFDYVCRYVNAGYLPNFARLIERHGLGETVSEARYDWLEPWIQWVTAHTGKSFEEHEVFRLGDIVERPDLDQVWERLERQGQSVAAMSPMNARNATNASPFFVPDPWTDTPVTGSGLVHDVHSAVRQAVNENAQGGLTARNGWALIKGVLAGTKPKEFFELGKLAASAKGAGWRKAIFLDVFLAAFFLRFWGKTRPDFSTLFLNAGAHIQHHYMFSSQVYDGAHSNPSWYLKPGEDPLLEVLTAYDNVLKRIGQRCKGVRLLIATGLHQDPEPEPIYYWRPKNHKALMERLQVPHRSVEPRMSRDFFVRCNTEQEAEEAEGRLRNIQLEGKPVFSTDLQEANIFVELVYPDALSGSGILSGQGVPDGVTLDLSEEVVFVAVKNGRHNGTGYFLDTADTGLDSKRFPLADLAFAAD